MIKNEFKKYILKPSVFICLLFFFALNFVKTYELYYYLNGGMTQRAEKDYVKTAQHKINALYGGEITDEKIAALKADLAKAECALNQYGYVKEPIDGTYSGFPSLDGILLEFKIEDYRYAILYANRSNQIKEAALQNVAFYTGKNDFDRRENELIARLYGGRTVSDCVVQRGWDVFFDYKFSVLLCMFLIVLTVSPIVSSERENGFYRIINASGRRRSVLGAKILAAGIFTVAACGVFLAVDLLYIFFIYRPDGLFSPLYALQCYELCPFDMTVLGGILFTFAARMVFLLGYTYLVMLISSLCETNAVSVLLSTCAGFVLVITAEHLPVDISPTSLVGLHDAFGGFKTVNVFGMPLLSIYAAFSLTLILTVLCAATAFTVGLKIGVGRKKRGKRNALSI